MYITSLPLSPIGEERISLFGQTYTNALCFKALFETGPVVQEKKSKMFTGGGTDRRQLIR